MLIQVWVSGRHFLKNEELAWKTTNSICCQWSYSTFQARTGNLANLYLLLEIDRISLLKVFSDETGSDFNKCGFWYHIMKYVSIWKMCITQWTYIFRMINTSTVLQKHAWVKDPSNMQDRPIIFNVQSKESILIWFQISYYN